MKTPVTKDTIRQHWSYNWWKYALLVVFSVVGWNLIYTMTAYRPPEDKKVDFYVSGVYGDQTLLDEYLAHIQQTEMSDMEQMTSVILTNDEYYGSMQLSTYMAAGEGDVYLLDGSTFQQYASNGGMLPLESYTDLLQQVEDCGIAVDKGWRLDKDSGERHLFGIPASTLTGFKQYSVYPDNAYLCVLVNCGNNDNAVKLLSCLVRDMQPVDEPASATDLSTATYLSTATDLSTGTDLP